MENGSVNTLKFHFKAFDDYIMLHNSSATYIHSDPLPHTMKLLGMWQSFHNISCIQI